MVQRLFTLVVAAAQAHSTAAADGVDLVDKDDARAAPPGLLEQVAHAAGADADEHLDELGARDTEKWYPRFAGDGACEQRLARAGRSDEQHAARQSRAERGDSSLVP